MGINTNIQWCDHTWNPWIGCHKVSKGCQNCYMYRERERYGKNPFVVVKAKTTWDMPLKLKEPSTIFVCSWSDFFINEADHWRQNAYDIIKSTPQHTYYILTKRPQRISQCLPADWGSGYSNVWLGVTIESPEYLYRAKLLLEIPAIKHFVSAEPLLGDIIEPTAESDKGLSTGNMAALSLMDWIICGAESGNPARNTDIKWVARLKNFCSLMKIPFFLKQLRNESGELVKMPEFEGVVWNFKPEPQITQINTERMV